MIRRLRPLLVALAAALAAGVAATLAIAAAQDAWIRDGGSVVLALAAVFVLQVALNLVRQPSAPKGRHHR